MELTSHSDHHGDHCLHPMDVHINLADDPEYTSLDESAQNKPTARQLPSAPSTTNQSKETDIKSSAQTGKPASEYIRLRRILIILGAVGLVAIVLVGCVVAFLTWKVIRQDSDIKALLGNVTPVSGASSSTTTSAMTVARDCMDIQTQGQELSGIYNITIAGQMVKVYCDMITSGGGWTVLLRRQDNSVDFVREWEDYKNGFGNLDGEFWAGNELMHLMTSGQKQYKLRVDFTSFKEEKKYAEYKYFSLAPESDQYRLYVTGYSGTAGDSLAYHNTMRFTTKLVDNDINSANCAVTFGAPWWFNSCHNAFLTGQYGSFPAVTTSRGIVWNHAWGHEAFAKYADMKIRPN